VCRPKAHPAARIGTLPESTSRSRLESAAPWNTVPGSSFRHSRATPAAGTDPSTTHGRLVRRERTRPEPHSGQCRKNEPGTVSVLGHTLPRSSCTAWGAPCRALPRPKAYRVRPTRGTRAEDAIERRFLTSGLVSRRHSRPNRLPPRLSDSGAGRPTPRKSRKTSSTMSFRLPLRGCRPAPPTP